MIVKKNKPKIKIDIAIGKKISIIEYPKFLKDTNSLLFIKFLIKNDILIIVTKGKISFNIEGIHPYDLGSILDKLGIAVRTGHHCAQPIMDFFKIPGTVRASFAFYNTFEEIDALILGIEKAKSMLL